MALPTSEQILTALTSVSDPDLGRSIVALGMIQNVQITPDGRVSFNFELTTPTCPVHEQLQAQARAALASLPGVTGIEIHMTSRVRSYRSRPSPSDILPDVKQTIAIASGKGGVGKSTLAVNLAAALRLSGAAVGLLDADIYGPSVPTMTGSHAAPEKLNGRIQPLQAHGLKLVSFGHLTPANTPTIYRGPMVGKAIEALLQVDWGVLDYLVIDLPPGTGDASLTLAQAVPLTGVVIVCTPQDVAVDIAIKALLMFRKLNVTPLGIVENMSYLICPSCHARHEIFGHGGAQSAATRLGVPFLGAIPLEADIRQDADAGIPIVISHPNSPGARAITAIASQIAARVSIQSFRSLPTITVH